MRSRLRLSLQWDGPSQERKERRVQGQGTDCSQTPTTHTPSRVSLEETSSATLKTTGFLYVKLTKFLYRRGEKGDDGNYRGLTEAAEHAEFWAVLGS